MTEPDRIKLHPDWKAALADEFAAPYMADLRALLLAERSGGKTIYPAPANWFRALDLTPPDRVRVVILGQDPYHGPGQAHGLAFSVQPGVRVPPSLANIYKELQRDLGIAPARHGFLEHWASQGVLLLNNVLTVEQATPNAHKGRGWEQFTDAVVRLVSERTDPTVFLLWGNPAQQKAAFVSDVAQGGRHLVLRAPHPSPLSAHRGFLGCGHFGKANEFLEVSGQALIDWALPPL